MKRKIGLMISTLALTVVLTTTAFAANKGVRVFVKGVPVEKQAVLKNSRTFVPMRVISEELGFEVKYDAGAKKVSLKKLAHEVNLFTGNKSASVNGQQVKLDAPPFVKNDITYVPIRFVSEILKESVSWDNKNKIVLVGGLDKYKEQGKTETYHNKDQKYSLELPEAWENRALIKNLNGKLSVYDKATLNKLVEQGLDKTRPVFEIRISDYPSTGTKDNHVLLGYRNGKYVEAIFDKDMQYHKDTVDSYLKVREEGKNIIKSFKFTK